MTRCTTGTAVADRIADCSGGTEFGPYPAASSQWVDRVLVHDGVGDRRSAIGPHLLEDDRTVRKRGPVRQPAVLQGTERRRVEAGANERPMRARAVQRAAHEFVGVRKQPVCGEGLRLRDEGKQVGVTGDLRHHRCGRGGRRRRAWRSDDRLRGRWRDHRLLGRPTRHERDDEEQGDERVRDSRRMECRDHRDPPLIVRRGYCGYRISDTVISAVEPAPTMRRLSRSWRNPITRRSGSFQSAGRDTAAVVDQVRS